MNLNRVIQETLSLLDHQLQKAGVQIKTEFDSGTPTVHGNAGKLQQVFLNLFLNARDAMPAGGALEVRTWQEGPRARIEVADRGSGIAPEHLHRIYDPFFTTKGAAQRHGPGAFGELRYHSRACRFH